MKGGDYEGNKVDFNKALEDFKKGKSLSGKTVY